MKNFSFYLIFFLIALCAKAQEVPSLKFDALNTKIRKEHPEQIKVINFWATWCKPCIEELPYFESLQKDFQDQNVQVLLVSLDMELERATKYKDKKNLQSEVVYLDEVDHNAWIDKISPEWSGAIPATLIVLPDGTEKFYEKQFASKEELYQEIKSIAQLN